MQVRKCVGITYPNLYVYCGGNPINLLDPTGHADFSAAGALAVSGIGAALEALSVNPALEEEAQDEVVAGMNELSVVEEGLIQDLSSSAPETITQLQTDQMEIVQNQQAELRDAIDEFGAEGKGLHFQQLGKAVQDIADKAIEEAAPEGANIQNNFNIPGVTGPGKQIDSLVTSGNIRVFAETKYSLATDGSALTRVVNQLTNSSNFSGPNDSIILNVARPPTAQELTEFLGNLSPQVVHRVQVVTSVTDLYNAVKAAFHP